MPRVNAPDHGTGPKGFTYGELKRALQDLHDHMVIEDDSPIVMVTSLTTNFSPIMSVNTNEIIDRGRTYSIIKFEHRRD